jgi:hypothetical protein
VATETTIPGRQSGPSRLLTYVLGDGLGGALREIEEELSTLAEDPPQEAGHGEHDVAVRDGREHLLL